MNLTKLGDFTVPDNPNRLPFLIDMTKKIYDTYKSDAIPNATKNDALAQLLGFKSSNNGAYWLRLTALKAYGLLEGRGDARVSQLGKDITYGTGDAKSQASLRAFQNIGLWKELYDAHRLQLPSQDFWAKLAKIANCEPPVAKSNEQFVREAFEEDAKVIRSIKQDSGGEPELTPPDQQLGSQPMKQEGVQFIEVKAGPYYSRMPFDEVGRNTIVSFLQSLKFGSETKESKKGEK